jgi:hypothetical protein
MPELTSLEAVLGDVLDKCLDEGADELTPAESHRVRRLIRDTLEIADSPSSREPYQIADFIFWNCESGSRDAAERWLKSLSDEQVADLRLGDLLAALAPGAWRDSAD